MNPGFFRARRKTNLGYLGGFFEWEEKISGNRSVGKSEKSDDDKNRNHRRESQLPLKNRKYIRHGSLANRLFRQNPAFSQKHPIIAGLNLFELLKLFYQVFFRHSELANYRMYRLTNIMTEKKDIYYTSPTSPFSACTARWI